MATQEQLEQVRELANKVDALKRKVNSFIFWQKVRFLVCVFIGAIVGSIAAQLLVRWWSG